MLAINQILIARGWYNFDHYRHAIERMDPAAYLASSSDVRRLVAVETLVRERLPAGAGTPRPGTAVAAGAPEPPRFAPGSAVAVKPDAPATHSRTPRYVRGRRGVVQALRGRSVCPEQRVEEPVHRVAQQIYSVRFEASELWGVQGLSRCPVMLDLWEGALQPDSS